MNSYPSSAEFSEIQTGFDADPSKSLSLRKEGYVDPAWFRVDKAEVIAKTWQWVCHIEKLRDAGSYVTVDIAGNPIAIVRDRDGTLRAFYNVCKHRAHQLLSGEGQTTRIDISDDVREANLGATQKLVLELIREYPRCTQKYIVTQLEKIRGKSQKRLTV